MRLLAALALSLLIALPAEARPLNRAELRGLDAALAAYSEALETGDAAALTQALPPRMLRFHAGLTGLEIDKLTQAMTEQTEAMMATTRFGALTAETADAEAAEATLADGTKIVWAILPASFTMAQDGRDARVGQPVLALREGKDWFLLRVDPGQQRMLAAVYPFLADVTFPEATVGPAE